MSEVYDAPGHNTDNTPSVLRKLQQIGYGGGALGAIGLIGLAIAFFIDRKSFYGSYMFGYIVWMCLTLGCFGFTLLHHMIRGYWGLAALRIWEAGSRNLPMMALLFIPILFGMITGDIYHWSNPDLVAQSEILQRKSFYLNKHWWFIRTVLYFAFWISVSIVLNRSSQRQDQTLDESMGAWRQRFAAPCFLVFMITMTFAFTDWVMSLDDEWFSTIYGLWFAICSGISAFALSNLVIGGLAHRRPYNTHWSANLGRDLGNLMLALTMLWAYTSLSQFLIIWSGNLPEEIGYYVKRHTGPLLYIGTFLICFQFFGPFIALLSTRSKRTPTLLAKLAGWLLFMRVVDMFWTMTPFFRPSLDVVDAPIWALDLAALVGIGGLWLFTWSQNLKQANLIPTHDPRLHESYLEAQAHHA